MVGISDVVRQRRTIVVTAPESRNDYRHSRNRAILELILRAAVVVVGVFGAIVLTIPG